jgi:hypothetical protein
MVIPEWLVVKARLRRGSPKTTYWIYCIYNIYGYTSKDDILDLLYMCNIYGYTLEAVGEGKAQWCISKDDLLDLMSIYVRRIPSQCWRPFGPEFFTQN